MPTTGESRGTQRDRRDGNAATEGREQRSMAEAAGVLREEDSELRKQHSRLPPGSQRREGWDSSTMR